MDEQRKDFALRITQATNLDTSQSSCARHEYVEDLKIQGFDEPEARDLPDAPVPIFALPEPSYLRASYATIKSQGATLFDICGSSQSSAGQCLAVYFASPLPIATIGAVAVPPWTTNQKRAEYKASVAKSSDDMTVSNWLVWQNVQGKQLTKAGAMMCLYRDVGTVDSYCWYQTFRPWPRPCVPGEVYTDGPIFPLWPATGLPRWTNADPQGESTVRANDAMHCNFPRSSPFTPLLISPDIDPRAGNHSLLLALRPKPTNESLSDWIPTEYLCATGEMAEWDPPIMCIYKAPTWEPFKEDYLIRMGQPITTIGLRAVAVFSNIKDDDLKQLISILGVKDDQTPATPEPK